MKITYHRKKARIQRADTSTPIKKPSWKELGFNVEDRLRILDILVEERQLLR